MIVETGLVAQRPVIIAVHPRGEGIGGPPRIEDQMAGLECARPVGRCRHPAERDDAVVMGEPGRFAIDEEDKPGPVGHAPRSETWMR